MPTPLDTPGYRYALVRVPCDGIKTVFPFSFEGGYLAKEHVRAFTFDAEGNRSWLTYGTDYSIVGSTLTTVAAPSAGLVLTIYRNTPKANSLVRFEDGSPMSEQNLDKANDQAIFGQAEVVDQLADLLYAAAPLPPSQPTFEIANEALAKANQALADLTALAARVTQLENAPPSGIPDAPVDGNSYLRRNSQWRAIQTRQLWFTTFFQTDQPLPSTTIMQAPVPALTRYDASVRAARISSIGQPVANVTLTLTLNGVGVGSLVWTAASKTWAFSTTLDYVQPGDVLGLTTPSVVPTNTFGISFQLPLVVQET